MKKAINILESTPKEVQDILKEYPIAYVPFGSIEWHGDHNVLGVDSIKAYEICKRSVQKTGGVLFPTINWGAYDTMNFPFTFNFPKELLKKISRYMIKQLQEMGFRIIIIISGHYPGSQIKDLKKIAKNFSKKYKNFFVLGIPEQYLVYDFGYFGDHAAEWETSIMMAIDPNFVFMDRISSNLNFIERSIKHGIIGKDPKIYASKEKGAAILEKIVERLTSSVNQVLQTNSFDPFNKIYKDFEREKRKKFNLFTNLKGIFENQGIENKRVAFEYFKWVLFRKKKYNPNYSYTKNKSRN